MFRKLIFALAAAGAASLPIVESAEAAVADGVAGGAPSIEIAPVQKIQFFHGGNNYCFYPGGWRGPGWYWRGYPWRRGFGWGGGYGWRGWGGGYGWRGGGWRGGPGWRGVGWHGGGWRGGGHFRH